MARSKRKDTRSKSKPPKEIESHTRKSSNPVLTKVIRVQGDERHVTTITKDERGTKLSQTRIFELTRKEKEHYGMIEKSTEKGKLPKGENQREGPELEHGYEKNAILQRLKQKKKANQTLPKNTLKRSSIPAPQGRTVHLAKEKGKLERQKQVNPSGNGRTAKSSSDQTILDTEKKQTIYHPDGRRLEKTEIFDANGWVKTVVIMEYQPVRDTRDGEHHDDGAGKMPAEHRNRGIQSLSSNLVSRDNKKAQGSTRPSFALQDFLRQQQSAMEAIERERDNMCVHKVDHSLHLVEATKTKRSSILYEQEYCGKSYDGSRTTVTVGEEDGVFDRHGPPIREYAPSRFPSAVSEITLPWDLSRDEARREEDYVDNDENLEDGESSDAYSYRSDDDDYDGDGYSNAEISYDSRDYVNDGEWEALEEAFGKGGPEAEALWEAYLQNSQRKEVYDEHADARSNNDSI